MQENKFKKNLSQWITGLIHSSMPMFRQQTIGEGHSMSQFGVMGIVARNRSSTMSEIAQELGVSNAAASQIINRLVQEELLLRTEDPNDRRVKKIELSTNGKEFLHKKFHDRISKFMEIIDTLSEEELEIVAKAFSILKENFDSKNQDLFSK